jgi:hypothetical protein
MVVSFQTGTPIGLGGAGNYTKAVVAQGQPAAVFALDEQSTNGAKQVWFARRSPTSTWSKVQVSAADGLAGNGPSLAWSPSRGFAVAYYAYDSAGGSGDCRVATSPDGAAWDDQPLETIGDTGLHPAAAFSGDRLGVLFAYCRSPLEGVGSCGAAQDLRFKVGADAQARFDAAPEKVAGAAPESTALVVDAAGRFVAIWRDPRLGLRASRRSP